MALTFNTRQAFQKLLQRGLPEPAAEGIVEVVEEATDSVVTNDVLRAEFAISRAEMRAQMADFRAEVYRALWIQGAGIVAILGVIVGVANALD